MYKYVGMAQRAVKEDGEIKIMFLRSIDDSGKNFQVKEDDVTLVKLDEALDILKIPSLKRKGNRLYYEFGQPVVVYIFKKSK